VRGCGTTPPAARDLTRARWFALLGLFALTACSSGAFQATSSEGDAQPSDASPESSVADATAVDAGLDVQAFALHVTSVDTRFVTEDHFIASVEMQLSGEPFAQAMGRDLGGYTRDYS